MAIYLSTIFVSVVLYTVGMIFMKYLVKYKKITDIDFPALIFILYFIEIVLLLVDVEFKDWSYLTLLPFGNIGPLMFFIVPFIFLLPKKARGYAFTLIALLSPAMLLYGLIHGIMLVVAGTKFFAAYVLDTFCHILFSLYGVYLVRSKQADLDIKKSLISGAVILGVAVLMLILNAIFRTSFFGLSVYGDHIIYNIIFLDSAVLSTFVYFFIVAGILLIGYFFQKYLAVASKGLFGDQAEDASEDVAPVDTQEK